MSTENILQGILSQKIVQTGGVYSAKTDIVNVDNITATGDIRTNGLIDAAGGINLTGDITTDGSIASGGSITCDGTITSGGSITGTVLNLDSNTQPNISTTGTTLQISTSINNDGGKFDLNGNELINSGGNKTGIFREFITIGTNLNMGNSRIDSEDGLVIFGQDLGLNSHQAKDGSIAPRNALNNNNIYNSAIEFKNRAIEGLIGGTSVWVGPISNITGQFNIKDNCGTMTIDNTGSGTSTSVAVSISGITDNSIVIVTPTSSLGSHSGIPITYWVVTTGALPTDSAPTPIGTITINTSSHVTGSKTFNYFIAKYY
jgi:hypothetical protein